MLLAAIHNELMRTRAIPIQCRAKGVDSHSDRYVGPSDRFPLGWLDQAEEYPIRGVSHVADVISLSERLCTMNL